MTRGNIIFLNGTSSSGKTSLTKKLQEILEEPYFHLSLDVYENMAPEKHLKQNYWNTLRKGASGMHNSISAFSDAGLNVIVDHVILEIPENEGWLDECVNKLYTYPVLFVQVNCPLDELERREIARGDRNIGQAKFQLERTYGHEIYDLEVNTFENTLEECAQLIIKNLIAVMETSAFRRIYDRNRNLKASQEDVL